MGAGGKGDRSRLAHLRSEIPITLAWWKKAASLLFDAEFFLTQTRPRIRRGMRPRHRPDGIAAVARLP